MTEFFQERTGSVSLYCIISTVTHVQGNSTIQAMQSAEGLGACLPAAVVAGFTTVFPGSLLMLRSWSRGVKRLQTTPCRSTPLPTLRAHLSGATFEQKSRILPLHSLCKQNRWERLSMSVLHPPSAVELASTSRMLCYATSHLALCQ